MIGCGNQSEEEAKVTPQIKTEEEVALPEVTSPEETKPAEEAKAEEETKATEETKKAAVEKSKSEISHEEVTKVSLLEAAYNYARGIGMAYLQAISFSRKVADMEDGKAYLKIHNKAFNHAIKKGMSLDVALEFSETAADAKVKKKEETKEEKQ